MAVVNSADYLKHGWNAFVSARNHASTVLGNASADKSGIDAALNALVDTRAALAFNHGVHDVIADSRLKDETRYGAATWARYAAALDALEDIATIDSEERMIPAGALPAALGEYCTAEAYLLELPPLNAAVDDFDELDADLYASVAFDELTAIAASRPGDR